MKKNLFTIILIIFLLQPFFAVSQSHIIRFEDINEMPAADYPIYIDNKNQLDIENLTGESLEHLFNSSLNDIKQYKYTSFWLAVDGNSADVNNILQIYVPNAINVVAHELTSNKVNNLINSSKLRNDFYIIRIAPKTNMVLINIKTSRYRQLSIKTFAENQFFLKERKLNLYYGFIVGVFILLSLYHLVLFIKVKDRLYFYYILFILISGLLVIPHSGYITINSHLYYDIVFMAFQFSCVLIGAYFLKAYVISKRILFSAFGLIFVINLYGTLSPTLLGKYSTHALCLFIYLAILYFSIKQIRLKNNSTIWFLLPWLILLIAHTYYLSGLDIFFHYRQSIEVGLLANICFMALAVGNKLNIYKVQNRIAQSKELKAISEKDRIIKEQNKILELLIQERHKKILEKNTILYERKKEIEEKNEIINKANHKLRGINQELLNKNNEILSQNEELKKHHELLEIIVNKRTKKLLAAKERAIVADKLKTSFLNNLTQEINTPMNSITGFANLLNDKSLSKEKRNEYLVNINKNVELLLESIDNVVILARIQARILKPKNKQFKIKDLIKRSEEVFIEKMKSLGKNELEFKTSQAGIAKETPILSDYEKIWQILYKLLDNSLKFTEKGHILLKYEIKENKLPDQRYNLILRIEDTGVGIEKEKLDYILERFSNIEDDKTMLYHKTGIGLAIVKGLVDILNGHISVNSTSATGTFFQVEIPVTVKSTTLQN